MLGFCWRRKRVTSSESRSGSLRSSTAKSKLAEPARAMISAPPFASKVVQSQDSRALIMRSRTTGLEDIDMIAEGLPPDEGVRLIPVSYDTKQRIGKRCRVLKANLNK